MFTADQARSHLSPTLQTRRLLQLMLCLAALMLAGTAWAADWYVSPSGNDTNSCTTSADACKTIQAAIDKAGEYDTVHVAAGKYPYTGEGVHITQNGLTLIGEESPFAVDPASAPGTMNNHSSNASWLESMKDRECKQSFFGLCWEYYRYRMVWVDNAQDVTIQNLYIETDLQSTQEGVVATGNIDGLVIENNYIKFVDHSGSNGFGISINPESGAGMDASVPYSPVSGSFVTLRNNVLEPTVGTSASNTFVPKRAILFNRSVGLIEGNQMAASTTDFWLYQIAAKGGNTPAERRVMTVRNNWFFGRLQAQVMTTSGSGVTEVVIEDNNFLAPGSSFSPIQFPGVSPASLTSSESHMLRLTGNQSAPTIVRNNQFKGFINQYRAVWIQNRRNITIEGNTFTPETTATDFSAITVDNRMVQTGTPPNPVKFGALNIRDNDFLGGAASGTLKGKAVYFVNGNDKGGLADGDVPYVATIGGGAAADANRFAANIGWYIALDDRSCNSTNHNGSSCNGTSSYAIGEAISYSGGANQASQKAPFSWDVNAEGNVFGGVAMADMNLAQYNAVLDKTFDDHNKVQTGAAVGDVVYNWSAPLITDGTINFTPASFTWDGNAHAISATLEEDATATCVVTPDELTDVGAHQVSATCTSATHNVTDTGTITVNKASSSVSLAETDFVYDSAGHTLVPQMAEADTNVNCSASPASVGDVGSYSVTVNCESDHYQGTGVFSVTVAKAPGSVAWGGLVFDYDGSTHAISATHAGSGAACSVSPASIGPGVGSWTVTASCDGDANHEAASATATASVGGSTVVQRLSDDAYFPSLAAALADAGTVDGDILEVAPGTYSDPIVLTKGVHVRARSVPAGMGVAGTTGPLSVILDGGGAAERGVTVLSGVTGATLSDHEIHNWGGECFYAAGGNHDLEVSNNYMHHCGGHGAIYVNGNGNTQNVLIANNEVHDALRGVIVWNGPKLDFTIRDNLLRGPNLPSGIIFNDGTAAGVEIIGNRIENTESTGIAVLQPTSGSPTQRANRFEDNELINPGRYGLAVHIPDGSGAESGDGAILIQNNIVKGVSEDSSPTNLGASGLMDSDRAGISVVRRFYTGASQGQVDATRGVIVRDNLVTDFSETVSPDHEAYGLAIEGLAHTVTGNIFERNQYAFQVQEGNAGYPGSAPLDVNDPDYEQDYYDRGNAPSSCVSAGGNQFVDNNVDTRSVPASAGLIGGVYNERSEQWYCTIGAAIDDALAGDTLRVSAGTYPENVNVNKALVLKGPHTGVHGNDGDRGGSDEAVIHPASGVAVLLRAGDTTLDGFTIGSDGGHAVRRNGGSQQNVSVLNNRIENVTNGSGLFSEPGGSHTSDGLVIAHNRFANISGSGASAGRGIALFKGTTDTLVEDNDFDGIDLQAMQLNGGSGSVADVTIADNRVSDAASTGYSFVITNTSGVSFTGNTITARHGLYFSDKTSDFTVSCNTITASGFGVAAGNLFSNTPNSNVRIFDNAIYSTGVNFVNNMQQDLIAGSNWYDGNNPRKSGANTYVADALPTDPIGEASCGDNTPTGIVAYDGTGTQSTPVDTAFDDDLRARVQDALGGAVMGESVSFTDPSSTTVAGATLGTLSGTTNYNGEVTSTATANSIAGSYTVTASSGTLSPDASFALTNTQGTATITLVDPAPVYDGSAKSASFTTSPAGLEDDVQLVYSQGGTTVVTCAPAAVACGPTDAGSYDVAATLINNANYGGSASGTLTIQRAQTTIVFDDLSFVYDGSTHAVTAHLDDEPATSCAVTGTVGPDAGSYTVSAAACTGSNYEAPAATDTATVTKAAATVTLSHLVQAWDGAPKSVLVTTDPAGLDVVVTYDGSSAAPTDEGSYSVVATIDESNYTGTASGTLEIVPGLGDISVVVNGPIDPVHVGEQAEFAATMLANPALHVGEMFFFEVVLSKSGSGASPLDVSDIETMEVFYGGQWMDVLGLFGGQPPVTDDGNGNLVYLFPLGAPGYDDGFPILDASWTWNVRFGFATPGTYTTSWILLDADTLDEISPVVEGSAAVVVLDALPPTDLHLVLTGPLGDVEVDTPVDYTATMVADPDLHVDELFDVRVSIAKIGGNHALEEADLEAMDVFFMGSWQPLPAGSFQLDPISGELMLDFPFDLIGDGFEIQDPEWTWYFRATWADTGVYTLTGQIISHDQVGLATPDVYASGAVTTNVVEQTVLPPQVDLILLGPVEEVEVHSPAHYTGTLLANPNDFVGQEFWVRVRLSKDSGAMLPSDLEKMELWSHGWIDATADLQAVLIPDGNDLLYFFPQPFAAFEIDEPVWTWNFRFHYATEGIYYAEADLVDAAASDPMTDPGLAHAQTQTVVVAQTPDINIALQGPLSAVVGQPAHYLGTLTADPLPDASELFYVEVRIQRDGSAADPSDLEKAEIYWMGQWVDPVADLGMTMPWYVDGNDLVYLFPEPVMSGFPIDEPSWSWEFRFTWANEGLYRASATVVTADGNLDPVSNTAVVYTDVTAQVPDIALQLQGPLTAVVGQPAQYLGTLTADPLPDASELFYVEVRIQRDGSAADPSDLAKAEIYWMGDWVDPEEFTGQPMPWYIDGNDLVYLFPEPVMSGFPIDEPSWSWQFRFTWANEGLYRASATVVTADGNLDPVSNTAVVYTDVTAQVPDIQLNVQGAITGMVSVPVQYVGTLTADPLPDASELFYVEVRIQRDGSAADPSDLEKAEIYWGGSWVDPEEFTGQPIPWYIDGNDLVYLFPEPVMSGFAIDAPSWSWQFRFTWANEGLYTAASTVVTADGSLTPVSNTSMIFTEVGPLAEDIRLTLNGPVAGVEVEAPTAYIGRLENFGGDLPEDAYVLVRIELAGETLATTDVTLEVFNPFTSDWEQGFPTEINDGLEVAFPDTFGFPIGAGFDYTHQFRITYHRTGVFGAMAAVVGEASGEAYAIAQMFTEVVDQAIRTATIEFDPASLHAVYDGNAHAAFATTDPVGLTLDYSYDNLATVPVDAGTYVVQATVNDALYQGSATAILVIDKAAGSVIFDPLSAPYGTAHAVTATLDPADSNASCDPVAGVPAQDAPVGTYTLSASCESDNYTASATASYEVTASSVGLWPAVAADVGVVTVDVPAGVDKLSYYSWDSSGSAGELVRADFLVTSGNSHAQATDLEAEWFDSSDSSWKPLPMQFDAGTGTWSETFGPTTGFEPGLGASDFRVAFHRGGTYVFDASLVGVDSGLTLATSTPIVTEVAHIVVDGAANLASRVGEPVESAVTLANTGTAALSSGVIPIVPAQPAPNDENVRGRFVIHWDGGALIPADPNAPGGNGSNCGADTCASPDLGVEYYDAAQGEYVGIYNLRQDADGESLYGYFGSIAGGGLPVPAGMSLTNLFRLTAYQHTGTYTVSWQVVGLDSGTVYAEGPIQSIGVDEGEGAFIRIVSGDGGQAVVGGNAYDFGDLVVEVLNIYNNPVPGATVAFNVLPGAEGAAASLSVPAVTDASGQTSIEALSNDIAGGFEINAELSGGATLDVPFVLENLADEDTSQVELHVSSGDGQTAQVGTDYGLPLVVKATDRFGNALEGMSVEFSTPAAGASASVATAQATTDAAGEASSDLVTANEVAGAFAVTASLDAGACTSTTCAVDFALINTAGSVASVSLSASSSQAEVGEIAAYELTATVLDTDGNPVPGVSVSLIGPSAGAGVAPAIHAGLTDAAGQLIEVFDANTTAGSFDVQAVVSGTSPASVSLENLAGAPAAIELVSGSGQSTPVDTAFAEDLVVRVVDQYGNPVADSAAAEVSFSAPATGPSASVDATATSGAGGLASTSATANAEAGSYSAIASFNGVSVSFALTNTTGAVTISDIVWADSGTDTIEWDGAAHAATATVSGTSLVPEFTYNGSSSAPSAAGSYQVIATIDDGNVYGTATAQLTITPVGAGGSGIVVTGGSWVYDGAAHAATVANPNGVAYALSYDTPDGQAPVDAGLWTASVEVIDPDYASETLSAVIEITRVVPQIYLFDLEHQADGHPKQASAIVLPAALQPHVVLTYDPAVPIFSGSYEVTATITNQPNAEDASATATLIIHPEEACALFCDRFEAQSGGAPVLPGEGSLEITSIWSIAVQDESRQQVVLEILNARNQAIAWVDTATAGGQQWIRLRYLDAQRREQRSAWVAWERDASLSMRWDVAEGGGVLLRLITADGADTGLALAVHEDRMLPHSVRRPAKP